MTAKQRRHLHGGPSVAVEPHPTTRRDGKVINVQTTPLWQRGEIICGDCGRPLVFGRDGQYRHSR
jgi:hypothetical protein